MKPQLTDERRILQELLDNCKRLFAGNLKAVVLFGSRASGKAGKYSDYDILVIAENLPDNWRKRDALILKLDRHGIFDIILYTGEELKDAIYSVNPLLMNIFDGPHKILYGENFIGRLSHLYTGEIASHHILRIGKSTWKILGGIDVRSRNKNKVSSFFSSAF